MASIFEKVRDAWSVLRGVQNATRQAQDGARSVRYGSPPEAPDDDMGVLSASYSFFKNWTHLEPDRLSIYSDMDEMFTYVLSSAALEAYVEDATQPDFSSGLTVTPTSPNLEVAAELHKFFETIELEDRIHGDIWHLGKYGDYFTLLLVDEDKGVFDACPLEPRIVWRREDTRRVLNGFDVGDSPDSSDMENTKKLPRYKPWDMVHWRLRSKRISDPYGTPFFFGVRMIYKVLKLMEEQMTIYRMNMHPDRLVFKVFTGNSGPEERRRQVRLWRREMERRDSLDRSSGNFRSEYAPWQVNQNIYWPVGTGDQVSGVEKFPGSANAGDIFDVAYMRDLFFAGVRVPKAYMGFEDSQGYRGTDTLSAQSIKFARGVKRLQKHYLQGLTRLCMIHLACRGIDGREPKNQFNLEMSPTSYLDEAHKAELYAKRYEALNYMLDIGQKMAGELGINRKVWGQYILKEFGGWDDDMIAKLTAPETSGQTDMSYTPADTSLTFEQEQKARNLLMNDKDLSAAARTARKIDEDVSLRVNSRSQGGARSDPLPEEKPTTDRELFEQAKDANANVAKKRIEEAKKKTQERELFLRHLAQNWQDECR